MGIAPMSGFNTPEEAAKARYQAVRAGFVAQGTTLTAWCRENGTRIQNVRDAFFGNWNGPAACRLLELVTDASRAKP